MNANRGAGQVEGTVETTGQNTFFGKTAAMLQSVENSGGSLQTLLLQARPSSYPQQGSLPERTYSS